MLELEFVLSCGGDDVGFSGVRFVFVVGAVTCLFGFLGALVMVGDGMAQFRFQAGPLGGNFRPRVKQVADGVDRQRRAAARGRLADRELLLHREQPDHPRTYQRPIQSGQCKLRCFAAPKVCLIVRNRSSMPHRN